MEHLLLKAATTVATDQGEFEAVISTATIDREKDIVDPQGFVNALRKWVPLGKKVPLAWNHSTRAEDQIGYIDPATVRVQGNEVVAKGKIDLASQVGQEAWRMVKMGTLGFSFGYLVPQGGSTPRKGGGRHIRELDVFEVTATPAPMNGDTRVIGWKAVMAPDGSMVAEPDTEDDANECLGMMISMAQAFINDEDDPEDVTAMQAIMRGLLALQGVEAAEEPDGGKSIRDQAEEISRQLAHKDAPDKAAVELEALRAEYGEQAELVKTLEQELAGAKAALEARESDTDTLRRAAEALTLDAVKNTRRRDRKSKDAQAQDTSSWLIPPGELLGARDGELKATWTTAYVNSLPDSSFLYVEPGGDKDAEGKTTPRSLRHFPYKDAAGAVDLPHLRNALARIPQSSLPQDVKDRLTSRAQNILDNQKAIAFDPDVAVDVTDRGREARSVDPLVQEARALAMRYRAGDIRPAKPPREEKTQRPEFDEDELRRQARDLHRDLMLTALRGGNSTSPHPLT